ncbi:hypothetical protein [Deinococcus fonticola]|uniref:hypothetical protein n=1 Tax=Deinococcus fonticola TaxID=2528713 RepID=UPI001074EE1B|nr:hypothetical protein [Deinococcus fonticola]
MTRVQKKVRIYNVQVMGVDAASRAVRSNMREVFEYIEQLPFDSAAAENAYLNDDDGRVLSMSIVDIDLAEQIVRGRLASTRRDLLPQIEHNGTVTDPSIPNGAGYYDPVHFVYFLDSNRVAMEVNGHGPHYTKFAEYIEKKLVRQPTINVTDARIAPLISPEVYKRLQVDGVIAEVELEVYRGYGEAIGNMANGLGDVLTAMDNLPEGPTSFAITLKGSATDSQPRSIGQALQQEVITVLRDARPMLHRAIAKVRQPNPSTGRQRTNTVDLLEAKCLFYARPVQVRARVLDSASMFAEIITGYKNFARDEVR